MSRNSEIKRITRQIENLTEIRDKLTKELLILYRYRERLNGRPLPEKGTREVVSRVDLKPYIEMYLELYERQYGHGGRTALAGKAGITPQSLKGILDKDDQKYVMLETADKLLTAMNMPHILHEIDIITVSWGKEKWKAIPPAAPYSQYYEE